MPKTFKQIVKLLLSIYISYIIIGGLGVFYIHTPKSQEYKENIDVSKYYSDAIGVDKVLSLSQREDSFTMRINLIKQANNYLYMAYHAIDSGLTSDVFYASVLQAANRGVDVKIILDGFFHNLRFSRQDILFALMDNPNIEISFFEPPSLLTPWAFQNRLHDKYLIVDDEVVMTGGSNIGDRYSLSSKNGEKVFDRDIILFNSDINSTDSVIYEFKEYFKLTWDSKYNVVQDFLLSNRQKILATRENNRLLEVLEDQKFLNPHYFLDKIDWDSRSVPTNKITLIHNPITRLNKVPTILMELSELVHSSNEDVYIQSPYIVPTKRMLSFFEEPTNGDLYFITNSLASNPNYFGTPGYMARKNKIESISKGIYEYNGIGSIHGKSYLIGNDISIIGSFNFDSRSTFLSTESMVVIHSEQFALQIKDQFDEIIKESEPANPPTPKHLLFIVLKFLLYPFGHFM